jgi:predicted O-methyltransferase YrrM
MSNIAHDYIEEYIRELLPKRTDIIGEMEAYAIENNVPIIHPEVAQLLRVLIKTKGVVRILEVGTAIGYSAAVMAEAAASVANANTNANVNSIASASTNFGVGVNTNTNVTETEDTADKADTIFTACPNSTAKAGFEIVTIERDDAMYEMAVSNIKRLNMEQNIKVIKGDAMEVLDSIEGEFDMIFLDAAKGHYDHFLPMCLNKLKINGILVSDNALFRGMVATNKLLIRRKITIVKRMRKYLSHISSMPELETVVLAVGDGIALSTKLK